MTLQGELDRADAYCLLVNNLFQLDDGRWQANLRSRLSPAGDPVFFVFGKGATAEEAMRAALANAADARKVEDEKEKQSTTSVFD